MGHAEQITIAMLTYRRNTWLAQVLPLLVEQAAGVGDVRTGAGAGVQARIVIVDNDPAAGAAPVVAAAQEIAQDAGVELVHVHEPTPGIVAGRNRALEEAAHSEALVFIDDDELPGPGWLEALVETWRAHGCAAVTGPTPPVFMVQPTAWVRGSGVFDSWDAPDGAVVRSADTGNLLVDLAVVRRLGLRFDPRYGLTGGEDSLFTRRLTLGGGEIRFATAAVVVKRVPASRATRAWVLRRAFRSGSSWARVRIDTAEHRLPLRLAYSLKGLAKAGVEGAGSLSARLRGDAAARARREVSCRGGLGMAAGALGARVREYKRPARARKKDA